ncbi:hypothetical protein HO133_004207 [Letharia lupina]|uniref:Uncharacterized protein n=1 Tax=Letharia lupina TaxID=560253 RepID=A0A8H6FJT9_9LECA|nr:uncharacterized protein HO133_004207 [Letharia lupina]KAF6229870.1 hypothetical protein HO133_004207 [Letharia lupina]
MKTVHQFTLLLVALAAPSQAFAAHRLSNLGSPYHNPPNGHPNGGWTPHGWSPSSTTTTTTSTPTTSTTTTTSSTTAIAAATATGTSPGDSSCDGFALNFSGDLSYDYWLGGSFGNETGSLSDTSSFCFPNGNSGGRVNIGQFPDPGDGAMLTGNSLVECNPVTAGTPGCDVSYVDGFSVGITCTMANGANFLGAPGPIGCASNILAACPPDQQDPTYNFCGNPGFDSDAAVTDPWTDCLGSPTGGAIVWPDGDGYFYLDPDSFPVECTVHGAGTVGKRAVDDSNVAGRGAGDVAVRARDGARERARKHAEAHVERSRRSGGLARGLMDVTGETKL